MANTIEKPQSAEAVAYALMEKIFKAENKEDHKSEHSTLLTRQDILTTYGECIATIRRGSPPVNHG